MTEQVTATEVDTEAADALAASTSEARGAAGAGLGFALPGLASTCEASRSSSASIRLPGLAGALRLAGARRSGAATRESTSWDRPSLLLPASGPSPSPERS